MADTVALIVAARRCSRFCGDGPKQYAALGGRPLLRHAAGIVATRGGHIAHVNVPLFCEQPKVGPHRAAMVARIAEVLEIAAQATATVRLPTT